MLLLSLAEVLKRGFENNYIVALISFVSFLLIAKVLLWFGERHLHKITKKQRKHLDNLIIKKTETQFAYVIIILGAKIGITQLGLVSEILLNLERILTTIIIILVSHIFIVTVGLVIDHWGKRLGARTETKMHDELTPLLQTITKVVVFLIALVVILKAWNVNVGAIVASLGLASVILGFALKDSLGNIFGGMSLIVDKNFSVGDYIKIDTGEAGEVLNIGLRSTKIMTIDRELLILPNGMLSNTKIKNFAKPNNNIRLFVEVGVVYDSNVDKTKKVLLETLKSIKGVLSRPKPFVWFLKMGDYSLDFKLVFFINNYKKRYNIKSKVTTLVFKKLKENKIKVAYPTRTVYMNNNEKK